jgi:hypothetical protein
MDKKLNIFGGFKPEPGSKDAETSHIEGLEAMERDMNPGMRDRDGQLEDEFKAGEQMVHEAYIYAKRAWLSGDKRSEEELTEELHDLERRMGDFIMQNQKMDQGTYELLDSQDATRIEFAKKEIPSLANYIEERLKNSSSTSVNSIYEDWKNGKDFLKK